MQLSKYEELEKEYPDLFRHLTYGVECGEGWYELIREACSRLSVLGDDFYFQQIKEKFGGLRIYLSVYLEDALPIVDDIEKRSFTVCEDCGKPGTVRPGGYILTLCDSCYRLPL